MPTIESSRALARLVSCPLYGRQALLEAALRSRVAPSSGQPLSDDQDVIWIPRSRSYFSQAHGTSIRSISERLDARGCVSCQGQGGSGRVRLPPGCRSGPFPSHVPIAAANQLAAGIHRIPDVWTAACVVGTHHRKRAGATKNGHGSR